MHFNYDLKFKATVLLEYINHEVTARDWPIMLIFYLSCYAAVLKILTFYAHVETVLLEYIHLYH